MYVCRFMFSVSRRTTHLALNHGSNPVVSTSSPSKHSLPSSPRTYPLRSRLLQADRNGCRWWTICRIVGQLIQGAGDAVGLSFSDSGALCHGVGGEVRQWEGSCGWGVSDVCFVGDMYIAGSKVRCMLSWLGTCHVCCCVCCCR